MIRQGTSHTAEEWIAVGAFFVLLIVPLLSDLQSVYPYEYVQGLAFQVGVELLLGVLVVMCARHNLRLQTASRAVTAIVMAFIAWVGITIIFSDSPTVAFWGSELRHQGYLLQLHYVAFFGILVFILHASLFKKMLLALPITAMIVSVMGLFELSNGVARISSSFGHPNFLAAVLAMTLPVTLYYFFVGPMRFVMAVSLWLQVTALLLTYSRASWVAAGVATATVLAGWMVLSRGSGASFRSRALSLGILAIIIVSSALVAQQLASRAADDYKKFSEQELTGNPLSDRFKNISNFSSGSGAVRTYIWKDSIDLLRANFLFGVGPDNMGRVYALYYRDEPNRPTFAREMIADRAHNEFLDTGIALGVIGLALWLGVIAVIGWSGLRTLLRTREQSARDAHERLFTIALLSSLAAYLLTNQFGFSVTVSAILFWTVAAGLIKQSVPEGVGAKHLAIRSRIVAGVAVVFIGLVCLRVNVLSLVASHYATVGFDDVITGETEQRLKQAIRLAPHEQHYHFLLASTYYSVALQSEGDERERVLGQSIDELNTAYDLGLDELTYATSLATTYEEWATNDPGKRGLYEDAITRARFAAPNFVIGEP